MFKLTKKIIAHIKYRLLPPYNMYKNSGEQYYFQQYAQHILPYFQAKKTLLDIGCQYGRFTIPAAQSEMKVTATDIRQLFFNYIKKQCPNSKYEIKFRKEFIDETISNLNEEKFDLILCIELLYNLPNHEEIIKQLSQMLALDGKLICSHRTKGYYIYRFIKEGKYDEVEKILSNSHQQYNAQTKQELIDMYSKLGLKVLDIFPIGIFSGIGNDAFSHHANPSKIKNKYFLQKLETTTQLTSTYIENARYIGVICEKLIEV